MKFFEVLSGGSTSYAIVTPVEYFEVVGSEQLYLSPDGNT
jgi:hypothetical protein